MKSALGVMVLAWSLAGSERIIIVSGDDSSVTLRERLPDRVFLDSASSVYHYAGCPAIQRDMQRSATAAATLRGFRPHCPSLRKADYVTSTHARPPRDPRVISLLFLG